MQQTDDHAPELPEVGTAEFDAFSALVQRERRIGDVRTRGLVSLAWSVPFIGIAIWSLVEIGPGHPSLEGFVYLLLVVVMFFEGIWLTMFRPNPRMELLDAYVILGIGLFNLSGLITGFSPLAILGLYQIIRGVRQIVDWRTNLELWNLEVPPSIVDLWIQAKMYLKRNSTSSSESVFEFVPIADKSQPRWKGLLATNSAFLIAQRDWVGNIGGLNRDMIFAAKPDLTVERLERLSSGLNIVLIRATSRWMSRTDIRELRVTAGDRSTRKLYTWKGIADALEPSSNSGLQDSEVTNQGLMPVVRAIRGMGFAGCVLVFILGGMLLFIVGMGISLFMR